MMAAGLCWAPALSGQFTKTYEVVDLADGVFAIVWPEIAEYPVEGNHLVIERERDVVVVDANRTPGLTDTVIAVIATRTPKPVRYVVNTHWHADHVQGNAEYVSRFPGVEIIGHPATVAGIDSVLVPYRAEVQRDLEAARTSEDGRLDALERESRLYDHVRFVRPTLLVSDSIVLRDRGSEIRILHLGHGNTDGDLVVHLPTEGILAVGDLVTRPYPLLGWDAPRGWSRALDDVLARAPRTVVPGHGEVLRSMDYVKLFRDLMRDVANHVSAGVARGDDLAVLRTTVALDDYWEALSGGNSQRVRAFRERFQPLLVERAYREVRTRP